MLHLVDLKKSIIHEHTKIDPRTGKIEEVREHEDSRQKHAPPIRKRPVSEPKPEPEKQKAASKITVKPVSRKQQGGLSCGQDKIWRDADGNPVSDEDQQRLKSVPPAWKNVFLNPNKDAALQVKGEDAKGRIQYLYSAEHSEKAAAEKFARLKALHAAIPAIRESSLRDMNDKNLPEEKRDTAACLYLIYKTGFRVGSDSDTKADKKAFGASTLLKDHIKVSDDQIEFNFVGKKGVQQSHVLQDEALAKYFSSKKGKSLFKTSHSAVRSYLKAVTKDDFKVKDLRTYHGTAKAIEVINGHPIPTEDKAFSKFQKGVAKEVSAHLGNTPAMALKAYIDPSVWRRWA